MTHVSLSVCGAEREGREWLAPHPGSGIDQLCDLRLVAHCGCEGHSLYIWALGTVVMSLTLGLLGGSIS